MKTLRRVLPELKLEEDKLTPEFLNKLQVTNDDFQNAFKDIMPSAMREVYLETPDVRWSDIGGLDNDQEGIAGGRRVAAEISRPLHRDRIQHAQREFCCTVLRGRERLCLRNRLRQRVKPISSAYEVPNCSRNG